MTVGRLTILFLAVLSITLGTPSVHAGTMALNFEFNTPGNDEGWQHNGSINGGSSDINGPTAVTASSGEGVLTAQQLPGNGDLRVLYNPDIALPAGFTDWCSIEVRFRQLDGLNGTPQALAGSLGLLHLGINTAAFSIDGNDFVEETPGSTEFWYTGSLDISGLGSADILQIRLDPLASTSLDYELDYVRVLATAVPEPAGFVMLMLSALTMGMLRRR
jgi:hypothetical protein